ncbi:hypothetical protein YA36_18655 [Klebsiella aerogenes]|uniref:ead/Ea22-like family protein n=1 Tax=Klebsiella aerogenes TaxID=548 RepID=UPI00063CE42B|nr:ead/Ea22-like family protein [Klebsiella aerogenes]KLF53145.1 hypothetical protein YA36_18655 [Klebsiella aerogenes]
MTTDITELAPAMKAAAEKASNGDWVKESGDGWEACCSANDQANGGFIIAHFEGPDAAENRAFVQAANPANILALVEALEKAQRQIQTHERAELTWMNALELPDDATRNDILPAIHAEKYTLRTANKRIAELESRTVTVKLPEVERPIDGTGYAKAAGAQYYKECVIKALTAQDIKWEAE